MLAAKRRLIPKIEWLYEKKMTCDNKCIDSIQNIHFDFCPLIMWKNVNKLSVLKILIAGLLNI